MPDFIFKIKALACSYIDRKIALEINELNIQKGSLTIVLGKSGAGKSTFLESIGLMNNTIQKGSTVTFSPGRDSDEELYEYYKLWQEKSNKIIFKIRKDHFSFIFQETNLMPNFTAYENICIAQMIQGTSFKDARLKATDYLKHVGLSEIDEKKKTYELAGGQRQRIAFVRAITPEFTVLFGDEPTGNLDEKNAKELMGLLKEEIKQKSRTAIIVSHNIDLSLEFADSIIIITKNSGKGFLEPENIFHAVHGNSNSKTWENESGLQFGDMRSYIEKLL